MRKWQIKLCLRILIALGGRDPASQIAIKQQMYAYPQKDKNDDHFCRRTHISSIKPLGAQATLILSKSLRRRSPRARICYKDCSTVERTSYTNHYSLEPRHLHYRYYSARRVSKLSLRRLRLSHLDCLQPLHRKNQLTYYDKVSYEQARPKNPLGIRRHHLGSIP
jgi:hypothetical protein